MRSKMVWGSWAQIGFVLGFWIGSVHHKEIGKKQRENTISRYFKISVVSFTQVVVLQPPV